MVYLVKGKDAAENDKGKLILINFDQYIQFRHRTWTPDFIDLYGHELDPTDAVSESAAQVATMDSANKSAEMDIDTDGSHDQADEWDKSFQPADEVNDLFWCEEFDNDEPVNLQWYQEEMALWTDFNEGFIAEFVSKYCASQQLIAPIVLEHHLVHDLLHDLHNLETAFAGQIEECHVLVKFPGGVGSEEHQRPGMRQMDKCRLNG
ncbi:MAG: hypothetical protein Q9226_009094 [Calogaya cf. arnoldii]